MSRMNREEVLPKYIEVLLEWKLTPTGKLDVDIADAIAISQVDVTPSELKDAMNLCDKLDRWNPMPMGVVA